MSNFDDYKKIKNEYKIVYEEFDFYKVLSHEYIKFCVFNIEELRSISYLKLIYQVFKRIDLNPIKNAFEQYEVCFTLNSHRKDQISLIESFSKDIKNKTVVNLVNLNVKKSFKLNFKLLRDIYKEVFCKETDVYLSFKQKICIASYLAFYYNVLKDLEMLFDRVDLKGKIYLPFNSSFGIESLLTLFFKERMVDTYHLSHGVSYINYKIDTPLDGINGENINAEKIIVWGESSKFDLINNHQINSELILLGGNPNYPFKKISVKQSFKKCVVFLARPIYDEFNFLLIEIIGKFGKNYNVEFSVKPHPFSPKEKLLKALQESRASLIAQDQTIADVLKSNEYDFSIAYNTTVYYEAMYYGLPCFRFDLNMNEQYLGLNDLFIDEESLFNRVKEFKEMEKAVLQNKMEILLKKVLGMGINNYNQILSRG